MTYQQLIDQEFCRVMPTFNTLQQQLMVLCQSTPEGDVDLSLSSGKNSTFVFVFISGKREATIEFYRWHSTTQWVEQFGLMRKKCIEPPLAKQTPLEILEGQLQVERLEVARLRNLVAAVDFNLRK
jgi:hypothetical protein